MSSTDFVLSSNGNQMQSLSTSTPSGSAINKYQRENETVNLLIKNSTIKSDDIELIDPDSDVDTIEMDRKRESVSVDENGTYISQEELYQVKEMLTALATATDDHEDIVELLRSIQDQLRLAANKKKDLTLCVKSYRHFLKLKYNK